MMAHWAVLMGLLWLPATVGAADFDPRDQDWSGLSQLQELPRQVSLRIDVRDRLDWGQVTEEDTLVVLAPEIAPDQATLANLRTFLAAGGKLMVIDDVGPGDLWLAPFGLRLDGLGGTGIGAYGDVAALPIVEIRPRPEDEAHARAWTTTPVNSGRRQALAHALANPIVLNHPGSLRVEPEALARTAIWGYFREHDRAWLAETEVERGRVLAMSDPSALINEMLRPDFSNRQFAANLLRSYCVAGEPCRVVLLSRLASVTGEFQPQPPKSATLSVASVMHQLADGLKALSRLLEVHLVAIVVLLALALPILWLSRRPAPVMPPAWTDGKQQSVLQSSVRAWLDSTEADFRRPVRLMLGQLERELNRRWPARGDAGLGPELAAILAGNAGPQAVARLQAVFRNLHELAQDDGLPVSRAQFAQLAGDVAWVDELMQHMTAHERRRPRSSDD